MNEPHNDSQLSSSNEGNGEREENQGNAGERGENQRTPAHAPPIRRRNAPGRRKIFPIVLHELLSDVEMTGQTDIISWQPHGRCFIVHDTDAFVQQFLPRYFNQNKWSSFQRQLKLYSFERITAGRDRGGYYHPNFVKGEAALCRSIVRTKVKGTRVRVPADVTREPNFYLEPNQFHPQLGVAGLAPRQSSISNDAMLLPKPNVTETSSSGNAFYAALLQSMARSNPQTLQTVNPQVWQASQLNHAPMFSTSIPTSLQNVDLLRQPTSAATTLSATSATSENMNATNHFGGLAQGNVRFNVTAQVSRTAATHAHQLNHEAAADSAAAHLPAEYQDGNDDRKPAAMTRRYNSVPIVSRASSTLASDYVGGEPAEADTSVTHITLESRGQPAAEGAPTEVDQEVQNFLKRCGFE